MLFWKHSHNNICEHESISSVFYVILALWLLLMPVAVTRTGRIQFRGLYRQKEKEKPSQRELMSEIVCDICGYRGVIVRLEYTELRLCKCVCVSLDVSIISALKRQIFDTNFLRFSYELEAWLDIV